MLTPRRQNTAAVTVVVVVLLTVTSTAAIATVFAGTTGERGPGATTHAPTGTLAGTFELADANATFAGDPLERAGHAVISDVDVNGDGATDVLVAAPLADKNDPNSGAVYVFYGPFGSTAPPRTPDRADATLLGAEFDRAGFGLAAGDFDGDGVDDIAVGAPRNDSAGRNAGRVYLLRGGNLTGNVTLPAAADAIVDGASRLDRAGYAVAAVDAPTEGADRLLVGAPGNDSRTGGRNAGAAYLLVDPLSADGARLNATASATFLGAMPGEAAGYRVADAGDVTGDGQPEVLVGAPRSDRDDSNAGVVYVLGVDRRGRVNASSGVVLAGGDATEQAGRAIAGAGDTNGDGVGDIVVGAPFHNVEDAAGNVTRRNAGAVYIVHGPITENRSLEDASVSIYGESAGDRAGWSVAPAGAADGDCDGIDDVLVGAPYRNGTATRSGAAYLVYGNGASIVRNLSTAGATFQGGGAGALAGWDVAGPGDASGDGNTDVVVSATGADVGGNQSGAAYVVAGDCETLPERPQTPVNDTATPTPAETGPATVSEVRPPIPWLGLPDGVVRTLPVDQLTAAGVDAPLREPEVVAESAGTR
ncbi:integrin alpha [Halorarius halobius]|uniref:integrin alpha n=1 Tax=Halorarius halobius TaxID=2962671 RepID=UPI0020CCEFD0|nr:integrin alpha [Halorarius halobius]